MKRPITAFMCLAFAAQFAACGGDSRVGVEPGEVRELEEILIERLEAPLRITQGAPLPIKIGGSLPSENYMFDRALAAVGPGGEIAIKAYATAPFGESEPSISKPKWDDIIYISNLKLGHYKIVTQTLERPFYVIPEVSNIGPCPTVPIPIEFIDFPKYVPAGLNTAFKANLVSPNICVVPYRLATRFKEDSFQVGATAYDCRDRSSECYELESVFQFEGVISPRTEGEYNVEFFTEGGVILHSPPTPLQEEEEEPQTQELKLGVLSPDECAISPARIIKIDIPPLGFVGEDISIAFSGVAAQGNYFSPLRRSIAGGVVQYVLDERTCPKAPPTGGEVLLALNIVDKITLKDIGEFNVMVNGEVQGGFNALPACENESGEFKNIYITRDILSGEQKRFKQDELINVLLLGELEMSCDILVGVREEREGGMITLRPTIKRCSAAECKSARAEYHINYVISNLPKGDYAIDAGKAGKWPLKVE